MKDTVKELVRTQDTLMVRSPFGNLFTIQKIKWCNAFMGFNIIPQGKKRPTTSIKSDDPYLDEWLNSLEPA